eukprot:220974-Hanusia_phi.AAC.1
MSGGDEMEMAGGGQSWRRKKREESGAGGAGAGSRPELLRVGMHVAEEVKQVPARPSAPPPAGAQHVGIPDGKPHKVEDVQPSAHDAVVGQQKPGELPLPLLLPLLLLH